MKEDPPEDERPMTEEQWEKMMRESDVRGARFGELLETLIDHPNRDEVVAREMGWDELADAMADGCLDDDKTIESADAQQYLQGFDADEIDDDGPTPFDDLEDDPDAEPYDPEARRNRLKDIPAYALCERAGHAVMDALKPYQDEKITRLDEDRELICHTWIGMHIACAKISGGHAMGYDDDVLGGNIVNNKRGLEGARQAIEGLHELARRKVIPQKLVEDLLPMMREAEAALVARIEELRAKVWWK